MRKLFFSFLNLFTWKGPVSIPFLYVTMMGSYSKNRTNLSSNSPALTIPLLTTSACSTQEVNIFSEDSVLWPLDSVWIFPLGQKNKN